MAQSANFLTTGRVFTTNHVNHEWLESMGVGIVVYNNFVFPAITNWRVRSEPIQDSSGRTVKYIKYTFRAEFIFTPQDYPTQYYADATCQVDYSSAADTALRFGSLEEAMSQVRTSLLTQGKPFQFDRQGFGGLTINTNIPEVNDVEVAYGPTPKILEWESMAGNKAARIVWECEITVVDCSRFDGLRNWLMAQEEFTTPNPFIDLPTGIPKFPLEYSYDTVYSVEDGATTRTVSGQIEAYVYRNLLADEGGFPQVPTFTVDYYREGLVTLFPPLRGFLRKFSFNISADKRKCNFTIVDTEIQSENPLYPGMLRMDVAHTVRTGLHQEGGFEQAYCTLSGSIQTAPGVPRILAWIAFLDILNKRLDKSRFAQVDLQNKDAENAQADQDGVEYYPKNLPQEGQYGQKIVLGVSITEHIFSRRVQFSVDYLITTSLKNLFAATGLFTPVYAIDDEGNPILDHIGDTDVSWAKHLYASPDDPDGTEKNPPNGEIPPTAPGSGVPPEAPENENDTPVGTEPPPSQGEPPNPSPPDPAITARPFSFYAYTPRGFARLYDMLANSIVISQCEDLPGSWSVPPTPANPYLQFFPLFRTGNKYPSRYNSWIGYKNNINLKEQADELVAKRLGGVRPAVPIDPTVPPQLVGSGSLTKNYGMPYDDGMTATILQNAGEAPDQIRITRGQPTYTLVMAGHAMRAGYTISPPRLYRVAGQEPVYLGGSFEQTPLCSANGITIYGARWNLQYRLTRIPGSVDLMSEQNLLGGGMRVVV